MSRIHKTMRFSSLGSGSKGNATLVEKNNTCLLIDCGFSVKETRKRLERLGKGLEDLTAILITHEHSDHIRGVKALANKSQVPVWMTAGTAIYFTADNLPNLKLFNSHEPFQINDIQVIPYPVPHDAREPSQFVFSDGDHQIGLLTDIGSTTRHVESSLSGCDAIIIECNHDNKLLAGSAYPQSLKARISGDFGHLSNAQTKDLLTRVDCSRLQHLVAAHLSEQNNTPELARDALAEAIDCSPDWIAIADQAEGLSWREIA